MTLGPQCVDSEVYYGSCERSKPLLAPAAVVVVEILDAQTRPNAPRTKARKAARLIRVATFKLVGVRRGMNAVSHRDDGRCSILLCACHAPLWISPDELLSLSERVAEFGKKSRCAHS